jgi:hypothetical protein
MRRITGYFMASASAVIIFPALCLAQFGVTPSSILQSAYVKLGGRFWF